MSKILSSFSGKLRIPSEMDVDASVRKVFATLRQQYGDEPAILLENDVPPSKQSRYCFMVISLYAQILKLPPKDAATVLRYVLAVNSR